ncbi:hypothetical protein PPERSA_07961 [Pseudocohnilembus persalinus]|uniref:FHA domain-containing protein n=1 Tax=Pseudocohnilembus persalinus TaxID=266149 RepID=A0A0V0QBQ0_PSEPJ|nr:hypothetical protein PPERSA_07961 [Pseudocohnilembus persalinus]|eukprot:KRW99476.1 hypothetical protein PPERSA_07961 [Pseudocohnilembus persalinus]
MESAPKGLQGLKQQDSITFQVVKTSAKTGWSEGQKIQVKGNDVLSLPNKTGIIGRKPKDAEVNPVIDFGKDPYVSKTAAELIYKFGQFGIKASSTSGMYFDIQENQKYQALQDQLYKFDGVNEYLQIEMVFPNEQIQAKDQQMLSTAIQELDDQTKPLNQYVLLNNQMTKPQIRLKLFNLKTQEVKQEVFLNVDDVKINKEFVLGSGADSAIKLEGAAERAAVLGYSGDLGAWYVQGVKGSRVLLCLATYNQLTKPDSKSLVFRLVDGMQIACGQNQVNTLQVSLQ